MAHCTLIICVQTWAGLLGACHMVSPSCWVLSVSLGGRWGVPLLQELLGAVEEVGGTWLVTADHGNAEDMAQRDKKTGQPLMADGKARILTSHTLNKVRPTKAEVHYQSCRMTSDDHTIMEITGSAGTAARCRSRL